MVDRALRHHHFCDYAICLTSQLQITKAFAPEAFRRIDSWPDHSGWRRLCWTRSNTCLL